MGSEEKEDVVVLANCDNGMVHLKFNINGIPSETIIAPSRIREALDDLFKKYEVGSPSIVQVN